MLLWCQKKKKEKKKPTLKVSFELRKYVNYLPSISAIVKTGDIFIVYLMYLTILRNVNLIR